MKPRAAVALVALVAFALVAAALPAASPAASPVPVAALQHRSELIRMARLEWGLPAPVATFAAQIHAESAWRVNAVSPVGALGLAQFMPQTAVWAAELWSDLPASDKLSERPLSPAWAIHAMIRYDRWLYVRVYGPSPCDRWSGMLRAYNGGLGHWLMEARGTDGSRDTVGARCGSGRRSIRHCPENLNYPGRVFSLESRYVSWGSVVGC